MLNKLIVQRLSVSTRGGRAYIMAPKGELLSGFELLATASGLWKHICSKIHFYHPVSDSKESCALH